MELVKFNCKKCGAELDKPSVNLGPFLCKYCGTLNELDMEVMVSVDKDGVPHGFSATWVDKCEEGCTCYQSYSVYSTCSTRVIELADILGIEL